MPHRRLLALLGAFTALLVPVAIAGADTGEVGSSPDVTAGQMTQDMIGAWFVQLSGNPTADGGNATALTAKRQKFHADAKNAGIPYKTRYEFQKLWNGVSIEVSCRAAREGARPAERPGHLSGPHRLDPETTPASIPDLATAIKMTGADIAQNDLGYTGQGVKVAVMDTGIDLDHPDLGGDGTAGAPFTNSRVASQWDFVGDDYCADPPRPPTARRRCRIPSLTTATGTARTSPASSGPTARSRASPRASRSARTASLAAMAPRPTR